ncbi:DNA mismatch repair endonuclease MutL [Alkalihalobacillus sp. LMS39]|uniref:DNA mismatch repair endonuclease MutL n=1 Tax=Alkalihalobacillus sp. LMS39 TaxID=2924032 RepID=UPI001FB53913|nr:DNA mismatch repair endonuclease MutL [Alkalihalobacillus sp. LMS39]UOE92766.1 DNA mismatch repair endonuclease MutL [Alkalihalobacillus sp. LMS39]
MAKIVKLDEHLSNKIAAGEVVERPASIVKELVENAIDAGSSQILVEVEEGGLSKIRVLDNGHGIENEDVETAFYRHATSKIKTDKDLFSILTLGFRGEALPSIASVSFLEMNTSTGEGPGTHIQLEGGVITEQGSTKSRKGTEITVTNLFYNTPARLKYLKTIHTELGNITDVMNRLALAHPAISFQLLHNDKELLHTSGNGDQLQVIAAIYGRTTAKQMGRINGESLDFTISGYVAKPEVTRASRNYMSIFINGRFIKNYALARAIQEGYHTLLPIGRFPLVVLNVRMDPQLIDVNVHPSKLEVRLSKEEELMSLIKEVIQQHFKKVQLIPEVSRPKQTKLPSEQMSFTFSHSNETVKKITPMPEQKAPEVPLQPMETDEQIVKWDETVYHEQDEVKDTNGEKQEDIVKETTEEVPASIEQASERVPVLYPIGQMHGTYILAQNDNGLYIIDQHAAQERIKYEYFREKVGEISPEVQELLVPYTFEFTHTEKMIIEEHEEALKNVGIFLEPFGRQSYIVRSHPTWFPKGEEEETIHALVQEVILKKKIDIKKFREDAAIIMSCKGSIKANRHLRQDEMFALLESLRTCEDPFTCPHGRPIIVTISTYEMEKMFKRVM